MPQQLVPYWNALKRWWWLIVVSVLLGGVSAYFYWRNQPPVYQARTAMMVGNSAQSLNPDAQQLGIERTLATFYSEMAKRQPITQAVIQRLGLPMSPDQLGGAIETRVVFDAQILELYVYDVDPQRAAILATAIAEELIRQSPSAVATRGDTQEFIQKQVADLQAKIDEVDAQLRDLRDRMTAMTSASDLTEARSRVSELEGLKLDYTSAYTQYLAILNNQTINSLSIVEPASPPTRPVSTSLATTVMIAVAGCLVLSIGAIVLLELSDNVLRWGDVAPEKGVPVLGIIPALPRKSNPLILRSKPDSAEADAIRSLRTRIFLADSGAMIRKLLITSPAPRDGKSFMVVNLALAAADAGLRVIVVDGDVRAGSIHSYFGCEREPGLTNLLWNRSVDGASHLNLLRRTPVSNLWVLPAGTFTRDPLTLLRSPRLAQLMEELSERADLIIVDSPPVAAGPIATILSHAADGIVMAVSLDRTNRKLYDVARDELLKNAEAPLLGLALNRVSLAKFYPEHGYYAYGFDRPHSSPGLLARLRQVSAGAIGKITRRVAPSPNGHQHGAAQTHWLEDTPAVTPDEEVAPEIVPDVTPSPSASSSVSSTSEIMTTAEAAIQLEVPEETIEEWCRTGQLPAVRIGKRWLVTGLAMGESTEAEADGDAALAE